MGTEAFWVPVAVAALSGGAEYANNRSAQKKQETSQVQALQDQEELQHKASGQASQLTAQIASNTPDAIAAKSTGEYVQQLRSNTANADQTPVTGASARYGADAARSSAEVKDYGDKYAGEMGNIDAAVRQRQNEGLAMQTLGTNINTLNAQSFAKSFVDQLRSQAAGVPNPGVSLAAGMANAGARNYTGAGKVPARIPASNPYAQASAGWGRDDFGGVPA